MTTAMQLRSGTSGPVFEGNAQNDVVLWDNTAKGWIVGAFPAGVIDTDEVRNISGVPGLTSSDALDNVGVNPNFPPEHDNGNSGAAISISFASSLAQLVTLTANCTLTVTGLVASRTQWAQLRVVQGGIGGFTLTIVGAKTPGTAGLTLSAAAGSDDIVSLFHNSTGALYALVGGLAFG